MADLGMMHDSFRQASYTIMVLTFFLAPPMNTVCSVEPDPNELIEGETMSIACKSEGAFPPATLKLFNGTSRKLLTEGGQDTGKVSTTIAVSRHDNERLFYCTAENAATTILARTPKCLVVVQVLCE